MVVCADNVKEESRTNKSETEARQLPLFLLRRTKPRTKTIRNLPFNMFIPWPLKRIFAF